MTSPATLSGVSVSDSPRAGGSSEPTSPVEIAPSAPARVVVLASGTGSLLRSLLDAATNDFPARIVAVGTDRQCAAVDIATGAQLPSYTVRLSDYDSVKNGMLPSPTPRPLTGPIWWSRPDS